MIFKYCYVIIIMKVEHYKNIAQIILSIVLILGLSFSCIFSPKEGHKKQNPPGKWQEPMTPDIVVENLKVAFNYLDIDFYDKHFKQGMITKAQRQHMRSWHK